MTSLFRKEWREQLPLVAPALLLMGLVVACVFVAGPERYLNDRADAAGMAFLFVFPALFVAFFGSAPFCGEFTQGTHAFLASLPVSAARVFRTKFLTGLSCIVVLLLASSALARWMSALSGGRLLPVALFRSGLLYTAVVLVLHAAMVLSSALLRSALAAILCLPFVAVLSAVVLVPILAAVVLASPYNWMAWAGGGIVVYGFLLSSAFIVWRTTFAGTGSAPAAFGRIFGTWAAAALLIHTAAWATMRISLDRARAEARRQGLGTRIAEIVPPPVPEEANAAPVFNEAFALLGRIRSRNKPGFDALERMRAASQDADELDRIAARSLRGSAGMREFFGLLEEAVGKPACRFPINYKDVGALRSPHLENFRSAARILEAEVLFLVENGRPAEALRRTKTCLRLGDALTAEPLMISQLTRISTDTIAIRSLRTAVEAGACPPGEIPALLDILGKKSRDLTPAVGGELALVDAMLDATSGAPVSFRTRHPSPVIALTAPFFDYNHAVHIRYMTELAQLLRRPYHLAQGRPYRLAPPAALSGMMESHAASAQPGNKYRLALAGALMPAMSRFCQQRARYEATLDTARLGLLLRIHAARTGGYPDSLDALLPECGGKLPLDPFTGRNYTYRRRGNGFIVYSVGMNRRDEGGLSPSQGEKCADDTSFSLSR